MITPRKPLRYWTWMHYYSDETWQVWGYAEDGESYKIGPPHKTKEDALLEGEATGALSIEQWVKERSANRNS